MFRSQLWCTVGLAVVLAGGVLSARAQDPGETGNGPPPWYHTPGNLTELPAAPEQWLNSPPLDLDQLDGKALVLYYFEEQCPTCEKRWPELLATAERHRDKPVIFIAVNSGNAPQQIAGYVKRNRINWPVVVDVDRSFEEATIDKPISLQNIYRLGTRTAGGEWHLADPRQMDRVVSLAAEGGRWRVDPATVPDELQMAWAHVEIGNYAAAARPIMRAGRRGNAETKAAAEALFDVVKQSMDDRLTEVSEQLQAGKHWPAYQALEQFLVVYEGYPMHPAVAEKHKEVGELEEVKTQHTAARRLEAAIRAGSRNTPAAVRRAVGMLERVVEDYPETDAAAEAQALLEQVTASQGAEGV